jgi:PTH2 family peptidyl-tRNA hydrolase
VRGDLAMGAGKTAAQAGHAYLNCYLRALKDHPEDAVAYQADGLGTKVCLVAPNEFRLLQAHERALAAGLSCALITDSGHVLPPHFDGSPIITALGLGPARRDAVRAITKRFSLLK